LPLSLYQIQTKYRDEARPRAGILRGREFVMKDSYSFDVDDEAFTRSYQAHRDAYIRIFDRLGFDYVIVSAMSGAMGGSASEEFLVTAENGEDTYVRCTSCDYAANVEAVRVPVPPDLPYDHLPPAHAEQTPDTPTIQTLVDHLNDRFARADRPWTAADTLKNVLVVVVHPDGRREPLAIGLPGDREVDEKRLAAQLDPAELEAFTETDFDANPSLSKGYIGPGVLGSENASRIRYLLDPRVVPGTSWVTGADVSGSHVIGLVAGRDFTADGVIEAAEVRNGDPCPSCGGTLETARGIEMGHIFQLGRRYAEALDLKVLDQHGKLVTVTMGSYGIGVSRAVGAIAENRHDEKGLIWPRDVSPADVHVVASGKDAEVFEAADRLVADLEAAGVSSLYDDRPKVSPGVKFKDAELLGVPTIIVVGKRLADGVVEVRDRQSGESTDVAVSGAAAHVTQLVRG
jgi:prolyl-tRNA synthetase